MSVLFADQTSPEVKEAIERNTVLLLPVGQTEEHGPHLPVGTDTLIAERVARDAAEHLAGRIPVLVMPTVACGYSGKVMSRWPGTIRVRTRVVMDLLFDLCTSVIEMGFRKVMLVSGHGHHTGIGRVVVREVADATGVNMAFTEPARMVGDFFATVRKSGSGGAIHGGEYETSLAMHLGVPVDLSAVDDRDVFHNPSKFVGGDSVTGSSKVFWSTWALQESQQGIYGDPTVASAETGRLLWEKIIERYAEFIEEFWKFES